MISNKLTLALASIGVLTLQACGGGGTSTPDTPPVVVPPVVTPQVPATTSVPVTVIDGPIKKAQVCLDTNNNGTCDAGEPTAVTDENGKANLVVESTLAGKFPLIAVVGTDAIDMDRPTEAITTPFTMKAPADKPSVITPLTTLVQEQISATGTTSTEAEKQVKQQTGINVSLFEDFTKGTTDDHKAAATLARMVVVTTQQQAETVKNDKDANNVAISKADLDKAVQQALMAMLPKLVEALQDATVTAAADAKAKEAALLQKAKDVIATDGVQAGGAATAVEIAKGATQVEPTHVPKAGVSLANLTTTDRQNWFLRLNTWSLKQNTPDADGKFKYVARRFSSVGDEKQNAVAVWGKGSEPRRHADLHWNGAKWANCDINFENTSTARDAKGLSSYNFCDNREIGSSVRANVDVSGKPMIDVYKGIRAAGYTNLSIGGSDNAGATTSLGSAVFPASSQVQYYTNTSTGTAISYHPGTGNVVLVSPTAVAAGDKTACDKHVTTDEVPATKLEDLISRGTGTPCVGTANANTGPRNEGWFATAFSMGTVGSMPTQNVATSSLTAANYYTTNRRMRVAFAANNEAKFYSCQERLNGSTRNCDLIGKGTYAIETLGDARVMKFSGLPSQLSPLNYTQVYVERAGKVWYGYQDRLGVYKAARLNTEAAKALLTQINPNANFAAGSNTDPETPLKLTAASYRGVWNLNSGKEGDLGTDVTVNANGSVTCKWLGSNPAPGTVCTASVSDTGALTLTETATGFNPSSTASGQLNFLSGTGSGTYEDFILKTKGTGTVTRR